MKELLDSFWRAAAYCVHPKVIVWSLLPLLFAVAAVLGHWAGWVEKAVTAINSFSNWQN